MEKLPFSDSTRDNPIALACIVEVSYRLRPVGPGPLSQCPSLATTLMAHTGQRFGGPLPHQQPDRPQPHPQAFAQHGVLTFGCDTIPGIHIYRTLTPVSRGYFRLEVRLATCY